MTKTEKQFATYLESQGKTWEFEPCKLQTDIPYPKLNRNQTYTPDFWCPKDLRLSLEMTQEEFAKEIDVVRWTIIHWENPANKH